MILKGRELGAPAHATVNAALKAAAATRLGLVFVDAQEHETRVDWSEVRERARRMAAALHARGVQPGDRVAMVLPTGLDFMDAFFGALLAGAVPVPLYPPVRLGRMDEYIRTTARMLEITQARIVLSDSRVRLLLGGAVERARPPLGCPTVAALMRGHGEGEATVTPSSLGLIQFSSGSTVDPKPVALTQANLVAQVAMLAQVMPGLDNTRERGVTWLPLYHDMGLIGCLLEAVYFPGDLVLLPPEGFLAQPALWLRAISRHHGVVSPAPNFAYGLCLKRIRDDELDGVDLSCWRYALNGAEPISAALQQRFSERFSRWGFQAESLLPVYGLSEASLAVTFSERGAPRRQLERDGRTVVSVGKPVPGTEVELRDGRIWVKGHSIMREYFGNPEATARTLVEGWLDTGDLGFIDGDELFVSGRAKDVVIIRGANHAPQVFEEPLDGVDGVRAGCAVAVGYVPPGHDGEALAMLVEGEGEGLEQRIVSAVVERTSIKPHAVVVLAPGTLPRTSSGKLRRQESLRRWLCGELQPPKPVNAFNVGAEVAKNMLSFAKSALPPPRKGRASGASEVRRERRRRAGAGPMPAPEWAMIGAGSCRTRDEEIPMPARFLELDESLYRYVLDHSLREHPAQAALREVTASHPMAGMQIAPEQGQLMAMLVKLMGARRTIEVGVFTGYSALAVALALPDDGRLLACDISDEYTRIGRPYWEQAQVAHKIDLRLGPARETLDATLAAGEAGRYDFAFIDADKTGYDGYYERCLRLLRPGGLIAVDNTLWGGKVASPSADADTLALQAFNDKLHADTRIDLVLLPFSDGLTLARLR